MAPASIGRDLDAKFFRDSTRQPWVVDSSALGAQVTACAGSHELRRPPRDRHLQVMPDRCAVW
jgi:hypothetical protein